MKLIQLINRNSFLILAFLIMLAGLVLFVGGFSVFGLVVLVLMLLAIYLILRRFGKAESAGAGQTPAQLAAGKPTLVDFYSDY